MQTRLWSQRVSSTCRRLSSINKTYDDAMSYLNLTNRRKADLACGDDAARKADLATADDWSQKAMGARKANELEKEKKNSRRRHDAVVA